jgi:hypothetical protein
MPRLRGDDHPGAAAADHVAELLEHESGPVEVDGEDGGRRRLAGRYPGGVDDAGDVTEKPVADSTSVWTDARDDTSTVAVLTSNPASSMTWLAASAFSARRSASTTCLPALTRRAIAWPIDPAPMTTTTSPMPVDPAPAVLVEPRPGGGGSPPPLGGHRISTAGPMTAPAALGTVRR